MASRVRRISRVGKFTAGSVCAAFLVMLFAAASIASTPRQSARIDWILVIDTSASMVGAGGTKNIFGEVQSTVVDFVNQATVGDSVTIFTFDRDVTLRSKILINSNVDRGNLKQIIRELQATGQRTHIGKAIWEALNYSAELAQHPEADRCTTSIVLLTDGIEDVTGIPDPVSIPSNINLVKEQECKPFIFFVSLGEREHESQLDEFVENPALCQKGEVMRNPGAVNLLQAGDRIQSIVQASLPPEPPQPITVEVDPSSPGLSLGSVAPGETVTQTLRVQGSETTRVRIQLDKTSEEGMELLEPRDAVAVSSQSLTEVPIQLRLAPSTLAGDRAIHLTLVPEATRPNTLPVNTPVTATIRVNQQIQVEPSVLDFGKVAPGQSTKAQTVQIRSNGNFNLAVELEQDGSGFQIQPTQAVQVKAGEAVSALLTLTAPAENAVIGNQSLKILLSSTDDPVTPLMAIAAEVELIPPLWQRLAWLSIPLLALSGAIGTAIAWMKSPGKLEGMLQGVYPSTLQGESEPWGIDLAKQKRQSGKLSKLLADRLGASVAQNLLKDSDALIEVIKEGNQRKVRLTQLSGTVEINDQVIASDQVFDGDLIKLGAIKLRFDCLEFVRPQYDME